MKMPVTTPRIACATDSECGVQGDVIRCSSFGRRALTRSHLSFAYKKLVASNRTKGGL